MTDYSKDIIEIIKKYYDFHSFIPLWGQPKIDNPNVQKALETRQISSSSTFVDKFEEKICEITGAKACLATTSGTTALTEAILHDIEPFSIVAVTPLTFVATVNAIVNADCTPVFFDVGKKYVDDFVNAVVPVHILGKVAKIGNLGIPVVEDACQAFGVELANTNNLRCYSFNYNKIITCGAGGAIVSDDVDAIEDLKSRSKNGKTSVRGMYWHDRIGSNFRMSGLNAAYGLDMLRHYDRILEEKDKLARLLDEFTVKGSLNNWVNLIKFDTKDDAAQFKFLCRREGIETSWLWPLVPDLPMYRKYEHNELQNARHIQETTVMLPSWCNLDLRGE